MNKLFESKHQQRWLEREREISARAKAIKDGTYFNVEVDPRVSHDEWYMMPELVVPPVLKDDAEKLLMRYSQGFTDWKGIYGTNGTPEPRSKDPLRNAIDDAIQQLK